MNFLIIKNSLMVLPAGHHGFDIVPNCADGFDIEFFHQDIGHSWGKKSRQGGSQADALDTEEEKG
jgi:hypothetical protein